MIGERIKVLDHGYVTLTAVMGEDFTPARTARTSFGKPDTKTDDENRKLNAYLLKHGHMTPFEFCQVRYYMRMPIFVARQMVRHRTASLNEISLRYIDAVDEFYIPTLDRMQRQSENNKQGSSSTVVDEPWRCEELMRDAYSHAFASYEALLENGLAKELARSVLPLATYTEWYWQCDLRNTLHLLDLRLDSHAQWEIRQYAHAMLALIRPVFPSIIAAWEEMKK